MPIVYPKQFTAAGWKEIAKSLDLKPAEIGKTLVALEKAIDAFNEGLATDQPLGVLHASALRATTKAQETVRDVWRNLPETATNKEPTYTFSRKISSYQWELEAFDLNAFHGHDRAVERFNDRVAELAPFKTAEKEKAKEKEKVEEEAPTAGKDLAIDLPVRFTDADWKKQEKLIKVSATGVGKTLRDLDKALKKLNEGLAKGTEPRGLERLRDDVGRAIDTSMQTLDKTALKQKAGTKARTHLNELSYAMNTFKDELEDLDFEDHYRLEYAVERVNTRVRTRV